MINDNAKLGNPFCGGPMIDQFLGNWGFHVESWTEQNYVPVLLMKYEELIDDPLGNFMKLSEIS